MNAHSGPFNACVALKSVQYASAQMTKYLLSGRSIRKKQLKLNQICSIVLSRMPNKIARKTWTNGVPKRKTIAKPYMSI